MESGIKAGRAIASYLIPPVGIVTWAMIKDKRPKNARTYLVISVIAIGMAVGGTILYYVTREKK